MKIIAFPLYEHAAVLRPASEKRAGPQTGEIPFAGLGFDLLCPQAFEATWNGGPDAEDVEIHCPAGPADASQGFVRGGGEGRLTFHPGIQFKTESDQVLWARGPVEAPKDGLAPLEALIDSSLLPSTLTLSWRFTRPGQTVRFAAGEPFCTVLPYPKSGLQETTLEVVRPDDADAFARELQRMIETPAIAGVFERLGATAAEAAEPARSPEKPTAPDEIPFPPPFHVIPPPRALPPERRERLFRGDHPARISVILPATNESVLLRRTVEQFEATLPAGSEILVIDNGSTDGCADFLVEEPRETVELIRTSEPLGVAAARNLGLARARGEIVVFSDAHMDLPEAWWQPIADALDRPEVGVVGPGIGAMGRPEYRPKCGQRIAEPTLRLEWLPRQGDEPYPVPTLGGGFMAMRHETLKRAGAFDEGMPQWGSEDVELCVRYWLLGYEVWVVPEVSVMHYFRKQRPYGAEKRLLTHNVLRVALLHFNAARMGRVLTALRNHARFGAALAMAFESDVWQKRAEFAARRVRDDDWLFDRFSDCCHV